MSQAVDTEVLVVGAGPTGLLLGAELRRRGVDCMLIDSLAEVRHWDRATIVHPRSMEVFASLGLAERFLEIGVRQRLARLYSGGELLGEIDLEICGSPFGYNVDVSEEVTESILDEHLQTLGGAVQRGRRLVGLDRRPDSVLATIEHDGERQRVSARWVVGCDGLHSPTRELSGIEFDGHDIADPWAVFDVTLADWPGDYDAIYAYLERPPVILTPLPGRRWRVYMRPASPSSDLVGDAAAVIARYAPGASLVDVANPTRFHCHTKIAATYRAGRVLLAGDAAHVCTPAQGHGMNTGLQDAFNLGWKLALVCHGEADEALLDSYGAERRPVAAIVTESGDAFEEMQGLADADLRAERDRNLRQTFADPDGRHHEAVAEGELDVSYVGSPIVAAAEGERLVAGERLPDVGSVSAPGGDLCRLHELSQGNAGHTLLVLAGRAGTGERLTALLEELADGADGSGLFDAVIGLDPDPDSPPSIGRLDPAVATELGIDDVTLLAVRPDGHVGFRADSAMRTHLSPHTGDKCAPVQALEEYIALVRSGGAPV